jgi:mannose-6-phosphate isomerase-like protein (cupin superfamily)
LRYTTAAIDEMAWRNAMPNTVRPALIAISIALAAPALAYDPIISMPGEHLAISPPGGSIDVLATREQTDGQLGIIVINAKQGEGPGPAITHHRGSETWYAVDGTYEFHVGDKIFEGGPGTFVSVDAGQQHGFIAKSDGKLLVIFQPAGYEQFFMEWNETQVPKGPQAGALEQKYGVTRP